MMVFWDSFWDMVVSLYVGCTFASMRWTCTFTCIALSYIGFPNGARVFVTLLIRYAISLSPCAVTSRVLGSEAQGAEGYDSATQAVSIGVELGFFSVAPVY